MEKSKRIKTRFGGVQGVTVTVWVSRREVIVAMWCDGYGYQKIHAYRTRGDFGNARVEFEENTGIRVQGKKLGEKDAFDHMLTRASVGMDFPFLSDESETDRGSVEQSGRLALLTEYLRQKREFSRSK